MQLIRGVHNIKPADHGCVLTIGNFDGVHLGHQRVLEALVEQAKLHNQIPTVMVFEPQPQEFFLGSDAPARLTRLRDKYNLLKSIGIKRLICVNFNRDFAEQAAEQFIEKLLIKCLGVKHLIIGDDFCFGKGRTGNFSMLKGYSEYFSVSDTTSYKLLTSRVSSTEIRKALECDELNKAQSLLGRRYSIIGKVIHGEKNGRKFGFPTANVLLKRLVSPVAGVYAVKVNIQAKQYNGVANIGCRPTLNGVRQQLEVNIFDFNESIYGEQIEVVMLKKIRREKKFESIAALTEQINKDSEQARLYFEILSK